MNSEKRQNRTEDPLQAVQRILDRDEKGSISGMSTAYRLKAVVSVYDKRKDFMYEL